MASLTHVCMWSENGWKRVSAEQASALHPGGTVSAHSGLFMCELCGQYVLLTDGDYQVRHFRHSSHEKSKDCPERTFGTGVSYTYNAGEHELPIRIVGITSSSFRFELGLVRAPIGNLGKDFRVVIQPKGQTGHGFSYSKERINDAGVTYLSIGEIPAESYTVNLINASSQLRSFWPERVKGIDPSGTLFDAISGRMLPYDADVEIGKEYYLLRSGSLYRGYSKIGLKTTEVSRKQVDWSYWYVYSISAAELNEGAARFFLDMHYRLTGSPVSFQPLWPMYVEGSYVLKHNQDKIYMLLQGNVNPPKTFPSAAVQRLSPLERSAKLYEISCSGRQQLISAGRTKALQYVYFWKEPLDAFVEPPSYSVDDIEGTPLEPGEYECLPLKGILRFRVEYDGEIVFLKDGTVFDKRKIASGQLIEIGEIQYGTTIVLKVGLDTVWRAVFKRDTHQNEINDAELYRYLTANAGVLIPSPHALRNMQLHFRDYPMISAWIRKCIEQGKIGQASYKRLQSLYIKMNTYMAGGNT